MNVKDSYRHFVAIAAGENPEENMKPYDMGKKLDAPIVVYKFKDAEKLRQDYIGLFRALLKNKDVVGEEREEISLELNEIEEMTDTEFYYDITEGFEYDPDTGDAMTRDNPNGKWISFSPGKLFSIPFILKDGTTSYSARKGDISWDKIHLNNMEIYENAWDMVMEGKKPETEEEHIIYDNMKNRTGYFSKFGNKENYVVSSTAFWGFAFVNESNWYELEDTMDQYEWMSGFYEKFIKPLPDDTLLTIFECIRG